MKLTAFAGFTFHPDFSAHHRNQPRRDGEAKSCSTELTSGRGVGLSKGIENRRLLVFRNSDTRVGDVEMEDAGPVLDQFNFRRESHLAFCGEFDGVA